LLRSGCRIFHVDVVGDVDREARESIDGMFQVGVVGDTEFGLLESLALLVHRSGGVVDVHLAGGASVSEAIARGADSVTVDLVTPADAKEARVKGCPIGVSLGEESAWVSADVDLISVFVDGSPGSVARVRELATSIPPGVCLQVEGDLGHESVRAFYEAGATVIVVGPSIFEREDLPRAYRRLVQALA
jgi:hypothetical protein